jgi:hypothetical protein
MLDVLREKEPVPTGWEGSRTRRAGTIFFGFGPLNWLADPLFQPLLTHSATGQSENLREEIQ